jgi:hypothetical protein
MNHKKTKSQVKEILRDIPQTRNNDSLLILELYRRFFFLPDPCNHAKMLQVMMYCPTSSIIRARTHIQCEEKMYLPTSEDVKKFRRQQEVIYKNTYGPANNCDVIREVYDLDKELDRKLNELPFKLFD